MVKNPPAKRHRFNPWVRKIPGGGNGNPLQYSCLKNPHEQRSLLGHSPQGRKEMDITEVYEHACLWSRKMSELAQLTL